MSIFNSGADNGGQPVSAIQIKPYFSQANGVSGGRSDAKRTVRFKLWEIQDCWLCMVIGTCLSLQEVRQAAKKAGDKVDKLSDYEVHRHVVECAANKSYPVTQRIQKLLDQKYAVQIKRLRSADTASKLSKQWELEREAGNIGGGVWAIITHPRATSDIIHPVYGDVHMLSHLAGAQSCADVARLAAQDKRVVELEAALQRVQSDKIKSSDELRTNILTLENDANELRKQHSDALQRISDLGRQLAGVSNDDKVSTYARTVEALQAENETMRGQVLVLEQSSSELGVNNAQLEQMLTQALGGDIENEQASVESKDKAHGLDLDLCGRCVLYIGGRSRNCRHYQALVETLSGTFLHHDGGLEESGQRIAELVSQADAVLCPTDCVSHSAMKKARQVCDKQDKPMIYMHRSSLSAFASSLTQVVSASSG